MFMKRWRVGSLSMGLILVAFGILLLVSLIAKINVINVIYMLSPIILICLGIEILLHLFVKNGDENEVKIKYDFLSIIFISIVLCIGTGVYILTGFIGFFETKEDVYAAFGIRNETVYREYSKEFEEDEIAMFGTFNNIRVLSTDSKKIKIEYDIKLDTSNKDYAESLIDKTIKFEPDNQRIRMISNPVMMYYDKKLGYPVIICTIYLPENKILDFSQCDYYGISIDKKINNENIIR